MDEKEHQPWMPLNTKYGLLIKKGFKIVVYQNLLCNGILFLAYIP